MIKYCLRKWEENKDLLLEDIKNDKKINSCNYKYLVEKVVKIILNKRVTSTDTVWDADKITEIDDGEYTGTLLYLIPEYTLEPAEHEYLMTFVRYGSCPVCDTLQGVQTFRDECPNEAQVKDFMTLCKDLVTDMIKPYNYGWRNDEEFEQVEMEEENKE